MRVLAVGVTLLLAAMAAAQWWLWPVPAPTVARPEVSPRVEQAAADTGPAAQYRRPPLDFFSEIWERPLFSETRRPVEEAAEDAQEPEMAEAEPPPPPPRVSLSAVVITGGKRTALIKDPATRQLLRKKPGDVIEGWRLAEVLEEKVVLTQGDERMELMLRNYDQKPEQAPVKAQRRAPPGVRKRSEAANARLERIRRNLEMRNRWKNAVQEGDRDSDANGR